MLQLLAVIKYQRKKIMRKKALYNGLRLQNKGMEMNKLYVAILPTSVFASSLLCRT